LPSPPTALSPWEGEKIYHTAEKLFPLSRSAPVGIVTYGSANLMRPRSSVPIPRHPQEVGAIISTINYGAELAIIFNHKLFPNYCV